MLFPCNVYRAPGKDHVGPHGVRYDLLSIENEEEFKLFQGKGWHENLAVALAAGAKQESLKALEAMEGTPPADPPAPKEPAPKTPKVKA